MIKTIDAKGLPCPKPVIEAKKALKDMNEGILEVLVDNEIAVQNLKKLGNYLTLKTKSEKLEEHSFQVVFQVGAQALAKENEQAASEEIPQTCQADIRSDYVVAIGADHMGEGEGELGRILIKGFLYALTELERLPRTVLLYNGGAKLSVEGSDSLEDLRELEAQGVEILTCGTCLKHYGLEEMLSVGSVTNMYEIVEKMTEASHVVKP